MGKQRIRTSDAKWYEWTVISKEEEITGECPICSGRLRRKKQDGFIVIPMPAIPQFPGNYYSVKENWIKLPPGQWACEQCRTIFQLTEIEKPVMIAKKSGSVQHLGEAKEIEKMLDQEEDPEDELAHDKDRDARDRARREEGSDVPED